MSKVYSFLFGAIFGVFMLAGMNHYHKIQLPKCLLPQEAPTSVWIYGGKYIKQPGTLR